MGSPPAPCGVWRWQCRSCVASSGRAPPHLHHAVCSGGDAAHALHQVERHPLSDEDRAGRTAERPELASNLYTIPITQTPGYLDRRGGGGGFQPLQYTCAPQQYTLDLQALLAILPIYSPITCSVGSTISKTKSASPSPATMPSALARKVATA